MKLWFKRRYRLEENLSLDEINEIMQRDENAILIDVRSPQEYMEWHLPGALNIPTYEIFEKAKRIIKDPKTTIICYCSVGARSKKAIKMFRKLGYSNLYHLDGGIDA